MPAQPAQKRCTESDVHGGSVGTGLGPRSADNAAGRLPDW